MKTRCSNSRTGFNLIEMLFAVACMAVLVVLFFPQPKARSSANRITCVNNLKQVGLSFRIYAGDHFDRYPTNLSTNETQIVNEETPVYKYFKMLENELGTPKVVVCPSDMKRQSATNLINFNNSNVSYFIGLDASENLPQTILAGDRNITNGVAPRNGILELSTNHPAGFTDEIHLKQGNIALGDGSVQQVSSARLRSELIAHSELKTNRIKLP